MRKFKSNNSLSQINSTAVKFIFKQNYSRNDKIVYKILIISKTTFRKKNLRIRKQFEEWSNYQRYGIIWTRRFQRTTLEISINNYERYSDKAWK